jgi:hypothetical protein
MPEKNYIELLKNIALAYLPENTKHDAANIFITKNKYGILHDLNSIRGKTYTDLHNEKSLNELSNDAFKWNKFLLKQKYNIDVEHDIKAGKYSRETAFALTTIYGHKGAVKYLKGDAAIPDKINLILNTASTQNDREDVSGTIVNFEKISAPTPKQLDVAPPTPPEALELPSPEIKLTKKLQKISLQHEQSQALSSYKKINNGEIKSIIVKNTLMRTHNLVDEKHSEIHSCFDDAAFFNSRFGFTSHFADPIEDTKHSATEIFNKNFSLSHWGFKNQNTHLQTSGFGAGAVDYSHSHKDFHLDQAFINRAQITIAPEAKELKIAEVNLNYYTLFKDNKSLMANYNLADGIHNFSAHFYSPYRAKLSGFVSGVNYNTENMSLYVGFNKDHKNISYEISPILMQTRNKNAEGFIENESNLGLRLSQSIPLKIFSNKQNVGIINSTILTNGALTNNTDFYINTDFLNLAASYEIHKERWQKAESGIDAHAVYNPFKKVAFYGSYENKKEGDEVEKTHKFGTYLIPIKNLMTNIEFKNENGQNMFGLGIQKIFNGKNIVSLEAEMNNHNFAPTNIKAKLNMALK